MVLPSEEPRFLSIIMKVPTAITAVPTSFTAKWLVSPNNTMANSTAMAVLDLSMGTTLFTSPKESALK